MPAHGAPADPAEEIREIDAELARSDHPAIVRQALQEKRAALTTQIETSQLSESLSPALATILVNQHIGGDVEGKVLGVSIGTAIFNRAPEEDERRRLVWYLGALSGTLYQLPLRGIGTKLEEGKPLAMPQVYVMLAVQTSQEVEAVSREHNFDRYFSRNPGDRAAHVQLSSDWRSVLKREYSPEWALPSQAIVDAGWTRERVLSRNLAPGNPVIQLEALPAPTRQSDGTIFLLRSYLATEAIKHATNSRLVLLGDPGSGKSTFFRHLAWALARRGLDQASPDTDLVGWEPEERLLPLLLPLRELAGAIAKGVRNPVFNALRDEMLCHDVMQVDDLLSASLASGAALVLFDGLDEVPVDGVPGQVTDRLTTLRAVRDFAAMHGKARIALTCRTRAFDDDLRGALGWPVETLAPFTLGQVRAFVPAMFGEIVRSGQLNAAQANEYETQLIDTIAGSLKLRNMAGTPLLLTMMAMVLYNKGTLPRDRPRLYEDVLELLLGQWDKVRQGQSLAEVIGRPDWGSERIRPLLNRLSYEAHQTASSEDGRGRIGRANLQSELIQFFRDAKLAEPWNIADRCLRYFVDRSGLIMPDETADYVFAHLTLQEHCAGCHMVTGEGALARIMQHRGDDRWREPIMLGLGYIMDKRPELIEKTLNRLIDRAEDDHRKPAARWHRDLILAAEIGADREWGYLRNLELAVDGTKGLENRLRTGLVQLLADRRQPLPTAERVRAGILLGDIGDPRFPVTIDQWRREVERAAKGDTKGYFCCVRAGTYVIGSRDDDPDAEDEEKPQHTVTFDAPFWIGRFPITNDQWQTWKGPGEVVSDNISSSPRGPNWPVGGVSQHSAKAFCQWLSDHVATIIRLPTEFEWEAAARGGDDRRYPWGDVWNTHYVASLGDTGTGVWPSTAPVGCSPSGASPCGVLDMAGNVQEWTESPYKSYTSATKAFPDVAVTAILRGGGFQSDPPHCRCAARRWNRAVYDCAGLRVLLAPPLASS